MISLSGLTGNTLILIGNTNEVITKDDFLVLRSDCYENMPIFLAHSEVVKTDLRRYIEDLVEEEGYEDMDLDVLSDIQQCQEVLIGFKMLDAILAKHPIFRRGKQINIDM